MGQSRRHVEQTTGLEPLHLSYLREEDPEVGLLYVEDSQLPKENVDQEHLLEHLPLAQW